MPRQKKSAAIVRRTPAQRRSLQVPQSRDPGSARIPQKDEPLTNAHGH